LPITDTCVLLERGTTVWQGLPSSLDANLRHRYLADINMPSFEFKHPVLFQHCDPAGMVFYPRYFEMVNACVETWFADKLLVSFKRLHLELGLSVPTVSTQTNFCAPSRLGTY
tara:strand:+ start:1969 stop:2307 length:339 start_codon:yes stop_codon:yes gene_type:complete